MNFFIFLLHIHAVQRVTTPTPLHIDIHLKILQNNEFDITGFLSSFTIISCKQLLKRSLDHKLFNHHRLAIFRMSSLMLYDVTCIVISCFCECLMLTYLFVLSISYN